MKSIWLITYNLDNVTAGPVVRFKRYAPLFLAKGYRLTFVTRKVKSSDPSFEVRDGYDVLRIKSDLGFLRVTTFITKSLIKCLFNKKAPDYIFLFAITIYQLWLFPFLRFRKLKMLYISTMALKEIQFEEQSSLKKIFKGINFKLQQMLFRSIDKIVTSSKNLSLDFLNLGVDESKLEVINNGVNTSRFSPISRENKNHLRKELDLPEDFKIILYVGLRTERKGLLDLIDAWKIFYNTNKNTILLLVGEDKVSASSESFNKKWNNIKDSIKNGKTGMVLRDKCEEVEKYFGASDLFIFLSFKEGMPNVILEAMASGLPVITTRFEGFSNEFGENGKHLITTERNPEIISSHIERCLKDMQYYETIRKNALNNILENFRVERSIQKYIDIIESKL